MAAFKGYLLKGTKSNTEFPSKYISLDTWSSNPKQKEYLKAYRDDNTRNLTKVAASGRKSTFKFTIPKTDLKGRTEIKAFLEANQDLTEDIHLEYWDDKNLIYRTGSFYIPNMEFKIIKITDNNIYYDELSIEFIEN